jgi:hypothetical protein
MKSVFFFTALMVPLSGWAQRIAFDIATFTPPPNWTKNETQSMISFTTTNSANQSYCVIGIYQSMASKGSLQADAAGDWDDLVKKQYQLESKLPITQLPAKNGWESYSQSSSFLQDGKKAQVVLTTFSNKKNAMSLICLLNDASYLPVFQNLCKEMEFKTSGETPSPSITPTASASFGDYVYQVPAGWKSENNSNQIILRAPDQFSVLTLLPMMNSSGNIDNDMEVIFPQVFSGWQLDERNPDHHIFTKGVAADGWEYFKKEVGLRATDNPNSEIIGFLFLAKLNNMVAVIAGTYVNWNDRLRETQSPDWVQFFHSLQFKNFKSTTNPLAKDLIGDWLVGGSSFLSTYTFTADGHYSTGGAVSSSHQISDYQAKETTTSFVGDGTYTLQGAQLTTTSHSGKKRSARVRIFYQSEFGTYLKTLGFLEKADDGSWYEATYRWQQK